MVGGHVLVNHNRLLGRCPGVDGGKTGYTKAAGRCLVSTCLREDLRLICVTLSDPDDWADHQTLYDWACAVFRLWRFPGEVKAPEIQLLTEPGRSIRPAAGEDVSLCVGKEDAVSVRWVIPPYLMAPPAGPAGEAIVSINGAEAGRVPLLWEQDLKGETPCVCKNL